MTLYTLRSPVSITAESSWTGSQRAGENDDEADGVKTGRDGDVENAGLDEMGRIDAQYRACAEGIALKEIIYLKRTRNLYSNVYCFLIFEWSFFMDK